MKKGRKLKHVEIIDGIVTAFDTRGEEVKLTRNQRIAIYNCTSVTKFQLAKKEFNNIDAFASDFQITKNGKVVFQNKQED